MSHRLLATAWARALAVFALSLAPLLAICAYAEAAPTGTKIVYGQGKIVPIPASIPHEEGDMIDRRLIPNLRWLAKRYPIYITDGYSGPLPNGEHAGCNGCHTKNSDHHVGLAVDIVALTSKPGCVGSWAGITRLALWAEPEQEKPSPPFRWVGYDGDAGHGCGHHLHLSWNHAVVPEFQLAEWVEVLPVNLTGLKTTPRKKPSSAPRASVGPPGGISQVTTGGVSPRPAVD